MARLVRRSLCVVGALACTVGMSAPVHAEEEFAITSAVPTLDELDAQIRLLVATPAPDAVKAAQLEGGTRAVLSSPR